MRKYLIATHCTFAQGIKSSAEYILGPQEDMDVINAYETDDYDLKKVITGKLGELASDDELVVLTDMFGGSVCNEFMLTLADSRVYLIAGVNLPMIMDLLTAPQDMPVREVIDRALQVAKEEVLFCNDIREEGNVLEEDF